MKTETFFLFRGVHVTTPRVVVTRTITIYSLCVSSVINWAFRAKLSIFRSVIPTDICRWFRSDITKSCLVDSSKMVRGFHEIKVYKPRVSPVICENLFSTPRPEVVLSCLGFARAVLRRVTFSFLAILSMNHIQCACSPKHTANRACARYITASSKTLQTN